MAQVYTTKQQAWLNRWSGAVVELMANLDTLQSLANEFSQDAYGTGGANALTDAIVQGVLPAATALLVAESVGAVNGTNNLLTVAGQGTTNRAYLEMMRP